MILNVCSHFGLEAQDMKLEPCLCSERGRRSRRPHRRPPAWSAQSSGRCSGCTSTESWTFGPGTGEILAWDRSGNPECVRAVAAAAVAVVEVCKAVEPSSCSDLNDLWTMCGPAKNKINRFFKRLWQKDYLQFAEIMCRKLSISHKVIQQVIQNWSYLLKRIK
jgi:hypothetical protein